MKLKKSTLPLALFCLAALFSCQSSGSQEEAVAAPPQTETVAADTVQAALRPAPKFHKIPTDMAKKRVYFCNDEVSDVFHVKHDCPVLLQCKANYKNVTLLRAVEAYGRYQCDTCSKDLAFIFEEGNVK
ncbi:hypothetical protein [Pontibacter ruber]|uniref:Rieske domain-containing protein n=1 Tax=Pontibacter ruber TaxID=1343895 RepID=A0ABW5CYJ1_9BACT|nr:hypothetical protein [Pontibacter ruber]